MNEEWFSVDDLESFCDNLTSGVGLDEESGEGSVKVLKELNDGEGKEAKEGEGKESGEGSVEILVQTPLANDLTKSNDALRALVICTPESSQEQQLEAVLSSPPVPCKVSQKYILYLMCVLYFMRVLAILGQYCFFSEV